MMTNDEKKRLLELIEKDSDDHINQYIYSSIHDLYDFANGYTKCIKNAKYIVDWIEEDEKAEKIREKILDCLFLYILEANRRGLEMHDLF